MTTQTKQKVEVLFSTPDHGHGIPVDVEAENDQELIEKIEEKFDVELRKDNTYEDTRNEITVQWLRFKNSDGKVLTAEYDANVFD